MNRTLHLTLAIALPLAVLAFNAGWKLYERSQGIEIRLPIEGFDPRDLLSGHYLVYRVNYGLGEFCTDLNVGHNQPHTICLDPKQSTADESCTVPLSGVCQNSDFKASIERFYIPEQYATPLDQAVRDQKGEIIITVKNGKAGVKDLMIEDKQWMEFIKH